MRRVSVDALQALPGGSRERGRVGGGIGHRQVARDGAEVVEAQLDADGAARRSPCAAGRRRAARTAAVKMRDSSSRSRTACRSRSKVVSRLIDTGSLCGDHRRARRGRCAASCIQRAVALAEVLDQQRRVGVRRARRWCGCPAPASLLAGLRPDAVDARTGSGQMRAGSVRLRQHGQAVGLVELAGDLGQQLVRRDADRAGQAGGARARCCASPGDRAHAAERVVAAVALVPPRHARSGRCRSRRCRGPRSAARSRRTAALNRRE